MRSLINFSLILSAISCAISVGIIGNKENIPKFLAYILVFSLVLCSVSLILEFIYFF
jgi:hypothetical protein